MPGFLTAVGAGRPCAFSVCRLPVQARPRSRHSRAGWATQSRFVRCSCRGERAACRSAASARWRPWLRHSSSRCGNSWIVRTQFSATAWGQASPWNYVAGFAAASCLSPSHCLSSARPALACRRGPDRGPPHEQFVEELRRLGGTSQAILENSELLDIFLPVLRADFALSESYDYRVQEPSRFRRLPMPVSPMRSPPVSVERWSDEVDGPFRMRRFAGGHFSSRAASKPSLTRSCATSRWLVSPPSEVESSGT